MSKLLNFITILGITMRNAFKKVPTSIGLVISEITCEMLEFGENQHNFAQ